MRRTARKEQLSVVQTIKDWIKKERHLPKLQFFRTLKRKLLGHYNYFYVKGNSRTVWSFYDQTIVQTFKWLNRRIGRKSYTWAVFREMLSRMAVPKPR